MTQKTNQNPFTMDVRVRERNLQSGALGQKELEKYLAELPDLADRAEVLGIAQPALAAPAGAPETPSAERDEPAGEEPAAATPEAAPTSNGEGTL